MLSNEKLEREIERASAASNGNGNSNADTTSKQEDDEVVRLRCDLRRANDEVEAARAQVTQLKRDVQKQ